MEEEDESYLTDKHKDILETIDLLKDELSGNISSLEFELRSCAGSSDDKVKKACETQVSRLKFIINNVLNDIRDGVNKLTSLPL